MAIKTVSIIKISGDENDYQLLDEEARSLAETAQQTATSAESAAQSAQQTATSAESTAQSALEITNLKLKSATLSTQYDEMSQQLTLSILTSTN